MGRNLDFQKQEDWWDHTGGKNHKQGYIKTFARKKKATVGQWSRLRGGKIAERGPMQMSQSTVQYSHPITFYSPTPIAVNAGVDFGVY